MIVLDTNVLSEFMRPKPHESVMAWVEGFLPIQLCTTAITVAEIRRGIGLLPEGRRRNALVAAAGDVFDLYLHGRILPFDAVAADIFADITTKHRNTGRSLAAFDAQIAAIARANDAILATRNMKDFQDCGVRLVNPWDC